MEMTIDEAIHHLYTYSSTHGSGITTDVQHEKAKRIAIDTMRRYQKIQQIVVDYQRYSRDCLINVREIIGDGHDD